jgi:hypothetical protein
MRRLIPAATLLLASMTQAEEIVRNNAGGEIPSIGQFDMDINGDGVVELSFIAPAPCGPQVGGMWVVAAQHAAIASDVMQWSGGPSEIAVAVDLDGGVVDGSRRLAGTSALQACDASQVIGRWIMPEYHKLGVRFLMAGQPHYAWVDVIHYCSGIVVVGACGYESVPNTGIYSGSTWPVCGSSDFNHDGDFGTDQDIADLFAALAGNCCQYCDNIDINRDGDYGTDADIEAYFRILAGSC